MLIDRGVLDGSGIVTGFDSLGDPGSDGDVTIPVPDSIQALVAARLDTLPAARKELLHDAAVVGDVFWDGAIATLSGRAVEEVRAELHELARNELVRKAGSSTLEGMFEYSFWHPLIRDVAYGQIPRSARSAKHRAFATWIERSSGDRLADRAEVLAHHYETALDLARASGDPVTLDLIEATGRSLTLAGDRAMRLDVQRAESYYHRALELLPAGDPTRSAALVRLAKALAIAGHYEDAERIATEAIEDFRAAGNMVGVGEAMAQASGAMSKAGQSGRSEAMLDEAREILEREPAGRELTRVYNRLAGQRLVSGRFAESLAFAQQALDLATELDAQDEAVRARQFRGAARCDLGDPGGLEDLWEALRAGLDLGLGEETALCYGNLAYQLWLKEGPEVARQVWSASIEFSEVRGFASHAMWGRAGMLEVLFDLGGWDELLATADRMAAWDETAGVGEISVFAAYYRGMVLAYRHEFDEAAELETIYLPNARAIGHPEVLAPALYAAMVLEAGRGRLDAAADLAQEFGDVTSDQPGFRAHYIPGVVRVMIIAGRQREASAMLIDDEQVMSPRHRFGLATARAQLEEVTGDPEHAGELFATCADDWRTYGFTLERAHALLGRGRCLSAIGRPNEATPSLLKARSIFAELGARGLVERVDGEIGRLTALTS